MGLKNKIIVTAIVLVAVCATGLLGFAIVNGMDTSQEVTVYANEIRVAGKHGSEISLIGAKIEYIEAPIAVSMRKSGITSDDKLIGNFAVEKVESECQLSILDKSAPYVLITNGDLSYAINKETVEETKALYQEILDKVQK